MDSWETRYMHEGKEYVRDDYSGTSIPLSIWQKMRTAYTPPATVTQVITKHALVRKQVKFSWSGQEIVGRVRKVTSTPEGDMVEVSVPSSRKVYFLDVANIQHC
jgi:hypothetical protein